MDQERRYQVFISHHALDAQTAQAMATLLRDRYGFAIWLHAWSVVPGGVTQQQEEAGLEQSDACAVLIGETGVHDMWPSIPPKSRWRQPLRVESLRRLFAVSGGFQPRHN